MTSRAEAARRRTTPTVRIGQVGVGSDHPIVVQSMTNTDTADARATANQVAELARAGSELVRITVNTLEAARAVPEIQRRLDMMSCDVPLVGDFHYNGHQLLNEVAECAEILAKYRINPGNVGRGSRRDPQFAAMIEVACRYDRPVRIGVNWGSLDQELLTRMMDENSAASEPLDADQVVHRAMIASAIESARRAEEIGLADDGVVVAVDAEHLGVGDPTPQLGLATGRHDLIGDLFLLNVDLNSRVTAVRSGHGPCCPSLGWG